MSRPLRLEHAGAVWHVTSRGNERKEIYRDTLDRQVFLQVLGRTVELFRWKLHAYVLMGNHYHLLLETPECTLSRGMRQLNGVYTQAFNRRHRRTGHLFQGRFKAILVEKESHLLELCRYVVLNPVRAGLVRSAREWAWSSYRATAGLERPPEWLETRWTSLQFASRRHRAVEGYRRFVAEGFRSGYRPWDEVDGQIYLGSDEFLEAAQRFVVARQPSTETPRLQRTPRIEQPEAAMERVATTLGTTVERLRKRSRHQRRERLLAAWALRTSGLYPLLVIGDLLGVKASHASSMVRAGQSWAKREPGWAALLVERKT